MISQNPGARISRIAETATGAVLLALGVAVVLGWMLHVAVLVRVAPGWTPMAFTTALCFVLSGGWLILSATRSRWQRAARPVAAALLVFASAATLQYPLGIDIGIDANALQRWLDWGAGRPGRMSPFSGVAFITASLAMLLPVRRSQPRRDSLALLLVATTGVVGALALVGYLFDLRLIYERYALSQVAIQTAAGLIALSVALFLQLIRMKRVRFWTRLLPHERITFASAAILTAVSSCVAISVIAALLPRVGTALSDGLAMSLQYRVWLAETLIEGGMQRARIFAGRPAPARLLRLYNERAQDAQVIEQLRQSAASLVADGDLAAVYFDRAGHEIVRAGRPLGDAPLRVGLRGEPGMTLVWKDGFFVSGRYAMADAGGVVGAALVEVPVQGLGELLHESIQPGRTIEAGLCAPVDDQLACFPNSRNAGVYYTAMTTATGEPLPMSRAMAGETGVMLTPDYRGEYVIAAYAPVGHYGLAMVAKADTADLYAPIRERLQLVLPILALLVMGGTLLIRAGVRPLAARLARSEREALAQHRALESMMAGVADGIMMLDADGTIRSWNAAAAKLFGYGADEIIGRNISTLVPEDLREANVAATRRYLETGVSSVVGRPNQNYPARRKDGSRFELEFTISPMGEGESPQLVAVFRDITARKEAEERLTRLALHDALTGLPNRPNFEQRVEDAFARCHRNGEPLALMILDLDNFKPINDTLGHQIGDLLLVALAGRLRAALRETDLLARIGGDEFTIVAEGLKRAEDVTAIADKVLAALREPFAIEGHAITASVSIGVALCRGGDTPRELMKRADQALYEAKGSGRARYRIA